MTQTRIITIDQTLTLTDGSISQPLIDAWGLTTAFVQAAARRASVDPGSHAYFDALTQRYGTLMWSMKSASRNSLQGSSDKATPSDIISIFLHPHLSSKQQHQLESLLKSMGQSGASISSFLDSWWKETGTGTSRNNFAIGFLTEADGSLEAILFYISFDTPLSSWRSLSTIPENQPLRGIVSSLNMITRADLLAEISSQVVTRLPSEIKDRTQQTQLDL